MSTTIAGRPVNRIGYGAMHLSRLDQQDAVAFLRHVVARGINHLDTAQFYETSNAVIRAALHPYPDDLVLATKVGAEHVGDELVLAQRPEQLRASLEANLATLGTDHVAVVNLRRADAPPGLLAEGDQRVDLDSQLAELVALRDAGKVGGIGLSNVSPEQLTAALPAGIVCVQNSHSVLDRVSDPVLEACRANDIPWVPFFSLGSAFPGFPKVTEHPTVVEIAKSLGTAPATVGLAWQLTHYAHTLVIPGTTDRGHLDDNLAADGLHLDPATMARLDDLA
ncbi:aldo/keto reductase [Actinophytocola sp.]|uniref:aldo/keto reductase n=1 Tax=Actinophytocola sp. TaxID=1872138 RepID=UPI002D3D2B20|nr:aldo/keto reductase [Actinophytocola sp.]HYQ67984.1 aldo/keto reductase [Actinophytocola sp.]